MPSLNFNGRSLADGALPRHSSPATSRLHERSCIRAGMLAEPRRGGGSGALRSAPPASRGLRSCWVPAGTPGLVGDKEVRGASGGARRDWGGPRGASRDGQPAVGYARCSYTPAVRALSRDGASLSCPSWEGLGPCQLSCLCSILPLPSSQALADPNPASPHLHCGMMLGHAGGLVPAPHVLGGCAGHWAGGRILIINQLLLESEQHL